MTEPFAPLAALTILEDQIIHIRRDYSRCFDELKRREKQSVGDLKTRVERLERRLGEVDESVKTWSGVIQRRIDEVVSGIGKQHTLTMKAMDKLYIATERPVASKKMLSNLQEKMNGWRKNVLEQIKTVDDRCLESSKIQTIQICELSKSLRRNIEGLATTKEILTATAEGLNEVGVHLNLSL